METAVKTRKARQARPAEKRKVRAHKSNFPIESKKIILRTQDYNDLIQWKRDRTERLEKQRTMFFYIGLSAALLLVITAFEWKSSKNGIIDELQLNNVEFAEFQDIPQTEQPPPPPPKNILTQPKIVEVPDEVVLEEVEADFDVEVTEDMTIAEIEYEPIEEEVAEEIFLIVEDKPEPVGGWSAFYKYVGENIRYPSAASREDIQGRVFVQFVVNSEGKISDVVVVKGIGGGCDEEAARIVANAPDWNPGKQRGQAVSVRMMLPITFMLAPGT